MMGTFKKTVILFLYFASCLFNSCAYDIRCIWPHQLGYDLTELRYGALGGAMAYISKSQGNPLDTTEPILARAGLYLNSCGVLCLAFHDPDVLDPFTRQPTFTTVPEFGHNGYSITLCQYQCWLHTFEDVYDISPLLKEAYNDLGLDVTEPFERPDIKSALLDRLVNGSDEEIMTILEDEDYNPYTMGHVVGFMVRHRMNTDGFNELGTTRWSVELQEEVPCSANCRQFQDTTGYNPVPDPRVHTYLSTDANKYDCKGYCRHWQPEQNAGSDRGTIFREEFAQPHVGIKARTYLRDAVVTLNDPEYDYYQESLQVVQFARQASYDPAKKNMVKFFQGNPEKGLHEVRGTLQKVTFDKVKSFQSFQDDTLLWFGLSLIEYEAIIQVWREKVHHDLVRPATVIKQWGDDTLNTYGGDIDFPGPVNIKARDFEPMVPNIESSPEFPSEHSCLCQTLMEFLDLYTDGLYGFKMTNINLSPYGSDVFFTNLQDFRNRCAESRIWGGYHYPDSVIGGVQKCNGLGSLGMDYILDVKNNSNFNGGTYANSTLPGCPILFYD